MQRKRVSAWPVLRASITLGLLLFSCCLFAEEDHSKHSVAGRQLPSPGPESASQFMQVNKEAREAKLTIIATYNDANYGMNFNGHFKGSATYQIPLGWKVIVEFKNMSPVPHSAVVVEKAMTRKLQVGDPYFDGAATQDSLKGLVKEDTFDFIADEVGAYAIACGFPAHATGGHWIGLKVSKDLGMPELILPIPAKDSK